MPEDHKELSPEEHHDVHILLHKNFDELVADFIAYAGGRPSNPIFDLMKWSHTQTIKPDHES